MSERDRDESVDSDLRTGNSQGLLQEIDFYAMALFIKILERYTLIHRRYQTINIP